MTLRQDSVLGPLDRWLASKFGPRHLDATIDELVSAASIPQPEPARPDDTEAKIAECSRKIAQYRAALDAGGDPAIVAGWITQTEAERAVLRATARPDSPGAPMSREDIASVVPTLADILGVLGSADPADQAEIYRKLGLRLTYRPLTRTVRAETRPIDTDSHWLFGRVRGATQPKGHCLLSTEFSLAGARS